MCHVSGACLFALLGQDEAELSLSFCLRDHMEFPGRTRQCSRRLSGKWKGGSKNKLLHRVVPLASIQLSARPYGCVIAVRTGRRFAAAVTSGILWTDCTADCTADCSTFPASTPCRGTVLFASLTVYCTRCPPNAANMVARVLLLLIAYFTLVADQGYAELDLSRRRCYVALRNVLWCSTRQSVCRQNKCSKSVEFLLFTVKCGVIGFLGKNDLVNKCFFCLYH